MFRGAKEGLKWLLNKLLLRSLIWETRNNARGILKKSSRTHQTLDYVSDSVLIIDKKIEYLSAKIDAHADVEDQFKNLVLSTLRDINLSIEQAKRLTAELRESMAGEFLDQINAKLSMQADGAIAEIDKRFTRLSEQIDESTRAVVAGVEKTALNEFRQTEALGALSKLLSLDLPLPPTRGWAASPDFLLHIYQHISEHKPKLVVELGSGVSTVVIAAALKANGDGGLLHSLDHEATFAEATSKLLAKHAFADIATVHHAPLAPWRPTKETKLGTEWQWYSVPETVGSLQDIDLLVIDGPPKATGPFARYPAVPHFRDRMASNCTVLLDDASREEERKVVKAWASDRGLRLYHHREFEKGLAVVIAEGPLPVEESNQ